MDQFTPTSPAQAPSPFGNMPEDQFLSKLSKLKAIAPAYGLDPKEVDSFVNQKQTEYLSFKGVPAAEIQKLSPDVLGIRAQEVFSQGYKPMSDTTTSLAKVAREGGSSFLKKFSTADERAAIAQDVEKQGGWKNYRQVLPLEELATDKEIEEIGKQSELLSLIDRGIGTFGEGGDPVGGTGPLAKFIPGIVAGQATRDKRAFAASTRAQYQRAVSGATVSDAEAKRLEQFLPTDGKTEQQNLEDLKRLRDGIMVNQAIFEAAKREGLTPLQAYNQFGKQVFESFGLDVPATIKNQKTTAKKAQTTGGTQVGRFQIEVE